MIVVEAAPVACQEAWGLNRDMAQEEWASGPSQLPDRSFDLIDAITEASADGITIQDASGRFVYVNDAAARMSGFSSGDEMRRASGEEILARFELLDESGRPMPIEDLPSRRALLGDPAPEAVVRFRRRPRGDDHWALVRSRPMVDDEGNVHHVVNVFVDITEDRDRQRVESFLADATKELARSLDWQVTMQRVASIAVPAMGDWCAVDVIEPDGSLSLVALAHVDPEMAQWARELRRRFPPSDTDTSGVAHVIRSGVSELIHEVTPQFVDAAGIDDPDMLNAIERLQLSSLMHIPLIARGRILGVLTMAWAESARHYTEADLGLGEELASRAAFAIDNARLYRELDNAARSFQARLLPKSLPTIPGVDVAARYTAADNLLRAGGDFYDLFEMEDGSWKAVIGDVCGKGSEAAALMGFVRFTLRAASRQDTKPSEALMKLNTALLEELDPGMGEFCTAAVVRLRKSDGGARLTIAVAGHPLPLILRATGRVEEAGKPGTLLGMFEDIDVTDTIVDLNPGDTVVMLTDGVFEGGRDEAWQPEVIPGLLAASSGLSPTAITDRIHDALAGLDDRRMDDVAMLLMKILE